MILCQRTRCQQDPVSAGPANIQPTKWKVFVKLPGGALQKEDKSDHTKYDGDFKNVDDEKAMGLVMVRGNPRVSGGVPLPLPAKTRTPGEGYGFLRVGVRGIRGISSIFLYLRKYWSKFGS